MTIDQTAFPSDAPTITPPSDQTPQTFERSIPKILLTLLICCIFVVCGAFMVEYPRPGRTDAVMGIFTTIFFGAGILLSLARLFNRRPIAVVTPQALSCPAQFEGQIDWRQIQKCELTIGKRSKNLTFTVSANALNALTWRAPTKWLRRAATAASQLNIPLAMVARDGDRLSALCLKYAEIAKSARLQNPELALLDKQNDLAEATKIANAERIKASLSFPFVTIGLIILLVALFTAEILLPATPERSHLTPSLETLAKFGGLYWDGVKRGEFYRLFSAALLHGNFLHILMNCVALLIVGLRFEPIIGSGWFAAIFAVSAVSGSLMSLGINPPTLISVGASGGIVGLFAATAIGSFHFPNGPVRVRLLITAFQTLIPSLLPLATAKSGMHIDYADHFGGAIGGALMGILLLRVWKEDQAKPDLAKPALITATLFFLIGLYPISRLNFDAIPKNVRHAVTQAEKGAASESDISRTANGLAGDIASVCFMSDEQAQEAARAALPSEGSYSTLHEAWKKANDDLFKKSEQACSELSARINQPPATQSQSPVEPSASKLDNTIYGNVIEETPDFYCAVGPTYYKLDDTNCFGPPVSGQPCRCRGTPGTLTRQQAFAQSAPQHVETACKRLGTPSSVVRNCTPIIAVDPLSADALATRGGAYLVLGESEAARKDIEAALAIEPDNLLALSRRARLSIVNKDQSAANDDIARVLRLTLKTADDFEARGSVESLRRNLSSAINAYSSGLELDPTNISLLFDRSEAYRVSGNLAAATADAEKAVSANPESALAFLALGDSLIAASRLDEAIKAFDSAIELDPQWFRIRLQRSAAYLAKSDYPRAKLDCDIAIQFNPKEEVSRLRRAYIYLAQTETDKAIEDLDEALKLSQGKNSTYPSDLRADGPSGKGRLLGKIYEETKKLEKNPITGMAYLDRGTAYASLGLYRRALGDLDMAAQLVANVPMLFQQRALVYDALGYKAKAEEDRVKAAIMLGRPAATGALVRSQPGGDAAQ